MMIDQMISFIFIFWVRNKTLTATDHIEALFWGKQYENTKQNNNIKKTKLKLVKIFLALSPCIFKILNRQMKSALCLSGKGQTNWQKIPKLLQ